MSFRTILHLDMNAFFASVEQQADPSLQGKPIAVTGAAERTVITTASYEARAYGVKTGMTIGEARRKCPHLILVVGKNRKYTHTSTLIMEMLRDFTPLVEVSSIDEAFLDVTGSIPLFGPPAEIALEIKKRIRDRFGLTCSVGIAPNKLLAKLASDMQKPDGLVTIEPHEVASILDRVPVGDMCGIGAKTQDILRLLGIRTCGDLGRFPPHILKNRLGVFGERLHLMGRGIDDSAVVPTEEAEAVKTVGHSMTLAIDVNDREEIARRLLQLSEMVGRRARKHGVTGKTVTLTVRYPDFTTFSRQSTDDSYTNQSREIYRRVKGILEMIVLEQPVRLLGVRLGALRQSEEQLSLFNEEQQQVTATSAMDSINDRYGNFTVTYGSLLNTTGESGVISPAWRPEGIRRVDVT
ncbi:DNA polymerase IV [Geobacter sp. DSM 9736]|uniref:DNA polymerase IV n=1 Tax=Geobacter sp. DSM 9736 TaxID=1277350 RepID=UPI000B510415|nr:DNA polymerase IV [Geobacter sp. DSM 9736]SNB45929.1 DNA polymerase-4 [Geobacter sp. DSM 9736]